jgi:hypothetical protein
MGTGTGVVVRCPNGYYRSFHQHAGGTDYQRGFVYMPGHRGSIRVYGIIEAQRTETPSGPYVTYDFIPTGKHAHRLAPKPPKAEGEITAIGVPHR